MRDRLNRWGFDHPDIFRKKSPCKVGKQRKLAIKLDIVPGDLEGKYNGKRSEFETRKLLDAIPNSTEFEKKLWS